MRQSLWNLTAVPASAEGPRGLLSHVQHKFCLVNQPLRERAPSSAMTGRVAARCR